MDKQLQERAKELGLPDGIGPAVMALAERVIALEEQLNTLQRATAHITSIQPIKNPA